MRHRDPKVKSVRRKFQVKESGGTRNDRRCRPGIGQQQYESRRGQFGRENVAEGDSDGEVTKVSRTPVRQN